jgi:hypothetical protein
MYRNSLGAAFHFIVRVDLFEDTIGPTIFCSTGVGDQCILKRRFFGG